MFESGREKKRLNVYPLYPDGSRTGRMDWNNGIRFAGEGTMYFEITAERA